MSPSALLTGGTGFVGSRVARRLLRDGFAVTVLARVGSSLRQLERVGVAGQATVARVASDLADLPAILAESRPDIVIHLAAASRGAEITAGLRAMIEANVTLPALLLEAMRKAGVSRFVNTGTSWQTAGPNGCYSPFDAYAATKQAAEDMLVHFCAEGMRAITLRLFDTYGPGDDRGKALGLMAEAAALQRPLAMSPGEQVIDLVHVEDVARAYAVAADRLLSGVARGHEVYGVSGTRLTLRALATSLGEALGREVPVRWGGRPYRAREVMRPWSGLPPVPGWAPGIDLAAGLAGIAAP